MEDVSAVVMQYSDSGESSHMTNVSPTEDDDVLLNPICDDSKKLHVEEPHGSTEKPEDMYRIIEHFCLGRRRLKLFGEDHNIRAGWLTLGNELTSSNFSAEAFVKNFADKDGKTWQGGGGRNPPPDAPHLVKTTPDIEALRPKSPMKNQQQLQQQSSSISINTANSNKRSTSGNMFTDSIPLGGNIVPQELPSQINPGPWPPAMDGFKGGTLF